MPETWRYPTVEQPAPRPRQRRAVATVRSALDAAVDLLDRLPEDDISLDVIRRASGVSRGSLVHHFGSRDALLASAVIERYARTYAADVDFLEGLDVAVRSPRALAELLVRLIEAALTPHRRENRWLRVTALAAAGPDLAIRSAIAERYTEQLDHIAAAIEVAQEHGAIRPDLDPRSGALILSLQAQGLILDQIAGIEVPAPEWHRLMVRLASRMLSDRAARELADVADRYRGGGWRAPARRAGGPGPIGEQDGREGRTADPADDPEGTGPEGTEQEETEPDAASRMLAAAVEALRLGSAGGLDIPGLREHVGLSSQAFHRAFGTRADFLRTVRLELEVARTLHAERWLTDLVATARTPEELRDGLCRRAATLASPERLPALWQRTETLAAARTDPILRGELAAIERAGRSRTDEAVVRAQQRGLIDPTLHPGSVSRMLHTSTMWHLPYDLDLRRPAPATWAATVAHMAVALLPER